MKTLVTGGAGFLGSHLCEKLLSQGHDVYCLDNFLTGSRDNIIHLLKNENFTLIEHDVVFPYFIDVERVYHLACPASPIQYQINPVKTIKTSVLGSINMLGLAKRTGARILLSSTSEVYGDPEVNIQDENYKGSVNTVGPRSCYDEGKRVAETLFSDYKRQHNVDIRIARIFNTYGPKMQVGDGRVVPNFLASALKNEPLSIYGDGKQTRSFCFVDDTIEGLISLMEKTEYFLPVNVGNAEEKTILELAQIIKEHTKSLSKLEFKALPEDDPKQRCPDISLIKKLTGWFPKISLDEGILKTIQGSYF